MNLKTPTLIRRFTRLSLWFWTKLDNLAAIVAIYVVYYNFVWMHQGLPGTPPPRKCDLYGKRTTTGGRPALMELPRAR